MARSFAHLHNHTTHSVLDGMSQIEEACRTAAEDDQPAIAITDHGTMSGTWKLAQKAQEHGLKPIMGAELYLSIGPRGERNEIKVPRDEDSGMDAPDKKSTHYGKEKTKRYEHLTVLARNATGWRNLVQINNKAHDSFFYKPRADFELIGEHSEGLIILTGCLGGPILSALTLGGYEAAKKRLADLYEITEKGSLFIEVMDHGIPKQRRMIPDLVRLAKEFDLPTVATNDAHYSTDHQAEAHDAMLCVNANSHISETDRFKFSGAGYYIRSAEEMRDIFDHEDGTSDACDSTLVIAEMCEDDVLPERYLRLPKFKIEPDSAGHVQTSDELLRSKISVGVRERYGDDLTTEVQERLKYEFKIIRGAGLSDYFLIVADLIDWSKKNGIRVGPGRGCLLGESQVWTSTGYKRLDEVAVDDVVRTHTGELRPVEKTFRYEVTEQFTTIQSSHDDHGITMTGDHKVLIGARYSPDASPEWVRADQVKVGDRLCIPRPSSPGIQATSLDFATLIPVGETGPPTTRATLGGELLGARVGTLTERDRSTLDSGVLNMVGTLLTSDEILSASGGVWFPVRIPQWVKNLTVDQKLAFLDGLWWGCGARGLGTWTYRAASREFAYDLRDLLWAVGAPAGLGVDTSSEERQWTVTTTPDFATGSDGANEDYVYASVRAVTYTEQSTTVYDLQVPVDHSFMTDSYVVHNSSAGSVISYCLGIVNIDPIKNHLLFERFLNPERTGMPDIDIDFDTKGRDRAISYLVEKYGKDHVARIGTFGFARTKRAIGDAARVLELPKIGAELSALVPKGGGGKPLTFKELQDPEHAAAAEGFLDAAKRSADHQRVVEVAASLEGVIASEGVHACGVIVGDEPLVDMIPLRQDRRKGHDNMAVTQWEGPDCEAFGLLKLDALGLRNLDIVSACVENIKATTGEDVDADNPPTDNDDPRVQAVWDMLGAGHTAGVFQLESSGMTNLCVAMGADSFDDLAAIVALYRPGPLGAQMDQRYVERKNGREKVDYGIFTGHSPNQEAENDVIASVLDNTYGVTTYQEQAMRLGNVVAGFEPAETNRLRKAISKKKKDEMLAIGELFIEGATRESTNFDGSTKIAFHPDSARKLWDSIKASGDYSFNASHSYGYGWLAYITAFLKANWPAQYGAALLAVTSNDERRQAILASLSREGIRVLPPNINTSQVNTTVDDAGVIHLGLSEVKGVGKNASWIVYERERAGTFSTLHDFAFRVKIAAKDGDTFPEKNMPVSTITHLVDSGALDDISEHRLGMTMIARAARDADDLDIPEAEYSPIERAQRERQRLGLLVGESPLLDPHVEAAPSGLLAATTMSYPALEIGQIPLNTEKRYRCIIDSWAERSWSGGRMAAVRLEGINGAIEGVIWNHDLQKIKDTYGAFVVGDVVDVVAYAKMRKQVVASDEETSIEDDDGMVDESLSVTIRRIAPVDVKKSGKFKRPTFTSLFDKPLLVAAEEEAPQTEQLSLVEETVTLTPVPPKEYDETPEPEAKSEPVEPEPASVAPGQTEPEPEPEYEIREGSHYAGRLATPPEGIGPVSFQSLKVKARGH